MYTCPVCYYDQLEFPPDDWHICYCCGTQFRYDDCGKSHEQLREEWIAGGCEWWSDAENPPDDWDTRLIQIPRGKWQDLIETVESLQADIVLLKAQLKMADGFEPFKSWNDVREECNLWDSLSSEALVNSEGSLE